jgi:hypothetical protein
MGADEAAAAAWRALVELAEAHESMRCAAVCLWNACRDRSEHLSQRPYGAVSTGRRWRSSNRWPLPRLVLVGWFMGAGVVAVYKPNLLISGSPKVIR